MIEYLECRLLLSGNPSVIDLLVIYTAAAASQAGGSAAIQPLIQASVDSVNRAMYNSQIPVTVRLVDVEETTYVEAGGELNDLNNLSSHAASLNSVFTLRNTDGADLVSLITGYTDGSDQGGVAYEPASPAGSPETAAFTVVNEDALGPNNTTFAHEIGHTLGSGHQRNNPDDPEGGVFPYSYGYVFTGADGILYYDIMSYDYGAYPNNNIFYYSNPNVSFHGVPTGMPISSPTSADLATTFENMAPVIAAYRPAAIADTTPPQADVYQAELNGSNLTVTIRFTDDEAVNIGTITSSTIAAQTMGGAKLGVTLTGIDQSQNSAICLATYTLTPPPGPTPALNQLEFFLQPGTLKDINGNTAAGGQILPADTHTAGFDYTLARDLGTLSANEQLLIPEVYNDGTDDSSELYRVTLATESTLNVSISASLFVGVYRDSANSGHYNSGSDFVSINGGTLAAGTYYIWVAPQDRSVFTDTAYQLSISNSAPSIGTFTASPNPVTPGTNIMLTAGSGADPDSSLSSVSFYLESNGIPGLQVGAGGDTLISTVSGASGWTTSFSTTGSPYGALMFYAQATDSLGAMSAPLVATDSIVPASDTWTGSASHDWNNSANWSAGAVPGALTNVVINSGSAQDSSAFAIAGLLMNGGSLQLGTSSGASSITSLSLNGSATLDINNNHLILNYGAGLDPIAVVSGYLTRGFNAGKWNGSGIISQAAQTNSSYALGYADGADHIVAGLSSGQIEIKYTLLGDADLDGTVTGSDFTDLISHLGKSVSGWDKGDFLYTGAVTGSDFTALVSNLGKSASGAAVELPGSNSTILNTVTPASTILQTGRGVAASSVHATPVPRPHSRKHR
jgi:hypothetical protein